MKKPLHIDKQTLEILKKIKKRPPAKLDLMVKKIHEDVFEQIDCTSCGDCCREIGPRINQYDLMRLATNSGLSPSQFVEKYLRIDEDKDYVFKSMPCPFLEDDNHCFVYDERPMACRDYPHTDSRRFVQRIDLSIKNAQVCPAVRDILVRLAGEV